MVLFNTCIEQKWNKFSLQEFVVHFLGREREREWSLYNSSFCMSGDAMLKLQGQKIALQGFRGKTVIIRLLPLELCVSVESTERGDLDIGVTILHITMCGAQRQHRVLYENTF